MGRKWESIICYEDRAGQFHTSRWRLSGIRTKRSGQNTDGGVLWLKMSRADGTVTAELFKDADCQSGDKIAGGSADVSGLDGSPANAVEVALTQADSSGIDGSFRLHAWQADGTAPVQVALCTDEDLYALWDGIESLSGFDATAGCADFIRLAGEDVLAAVAVMFRRQLGGHGAVEAFFIADAPRILPDLRRIANPAQLRAACAHRALQIAVGRGHKLGDRSMYSNLRDYHQKEYERALAGLVLAVRGPAGGTSRAGLAGAVRQQRV